MGKIIKAKVKEQQVLTVDEAIENLTTIAEMDIDKKTPIGILQNTKLTTNQEDFSYKEIEWLYPEDMTGFIERIKPSFEAILIYLREIYDNPLTDWKDETTKRGVQSIMALVVDAASKLNQYFLLFNKDIDFTKTKEFMDLRKLYVEQIEGKFPEKLDGSQAWEEEWQKNKEREVLDFDKSGVKDFSVVEADRDYELFYIKHADKDVIFSPDLIRNIKLYTQFDAIVEDKEHLFFRITGLCNKDLHFSSKQILKTLDKDIHSFYKHKFDWKNNHLAGSLNKSFMALMLSSNPMIYAKNEERKSAYAYFNDFKQFFRACFKTGEYQKTLVYDKLKKDKKSYFLLQLVNKLSYAFFTRLGGVKEEVIAYIHRMIRKGARKQKKQENISFWNSLLEKDDNYRTYLKQFPNGPLVKLAEDLESLGEGNLAFDPLMQDNIPQKLFDILENDKKIEVLHLPCPTHQDQISKAVVLDEFLGFLRELSDEKGKYLLINLQDTTSYREQARSKALIDLQKREEFDTVLTVITLSKSSSFYNQTDEYAYLSSSDQFIYKLKELLLSKEDKGFSLPKNYHNKRFEDFIDISSDFILETFFFGKKDLSKQERKDFIELFYHFLILKIIEIEQPEFLSFTCKDAIDIGSSFSASFFSFIKLLSSPSWNDADIDFLLYVIYEPALLIRRRAIEPETLIRHLSCMALFESHIKGLKKGMRKLYSSDFLSSLKVNYLH